MLLPPNLLHATKNTVTTAEKSSANFQLFTHAVQFCNCTNFNTKKQEVSAYLNINVTKEQQRLLNLTALNTVTGFIIKDSQRRGSQ
mmetsp:Transcript_52321/g.52712  ORF Transcript_52321/g.52712 Transcript_52321/m.52712 type:complete len:86 (-) Transcript_52321:104-361(-)